MKKLIILKSIILIVFRKQNTSVTRKSIAVVVLSWYGTFRLIINLNIYYLMDCGSLLNNKRNTVLPRENSLQEMEKTIAKCKLIYLSILTCDIDVLLSYKILFRRIYLPMIGF